MARRRPFYEVNLPFLTVSSHSYIVVVMNKNQAINYQFIQKCKEENLKLTTQRLAVYEEIKNDFSHPNADKIYQRLKSKYPSVSLDTVNRTLLTFAEKGIIKVVEGYDNIKRYDPELEDHHHFQCIKCHKIIDFENPDYDAIKLPANITNVHKVLHKKVFLSGICADCQKKDQ